MTRVFAGLKAIYWGWDMIPNLIAFAVAFVVVSQIGLWVVVLLPIFLLGGISFSLCHDANGGRKEREALKRADEAFARYDAHLDIARRLMTPDQNREYHRRVEDYYNGNRATPRMAVGSPYEQWW